MARVTVEICVDGSEGLAAAVAGGADRVELCSALPLGGLTPSAGLMCLAGRSGVPAMALIRPRPGDFVFTPSEAAVMEADITAARAAGMAGVVLGAQLPDGRLDQALLARLVKAAEGLDLTLHRCFDLVPDRAEALETAVELGFRRILTSGGAVRADQALPEIAARIAQAAGRISIMPGSGIGPENAARFVAIGAQELHGSCSLPGQGGNPRLAALGFAVGLRIDADRVRAFCAAVR
ncbi:copper homeostasis protein CutC [Fuscovulum blasticum]|uniref:copper homeostasis protein CutC n=1 Tax=Fuscovulum blasticum TaxID=1075 RepID=UPI000D3E47FD|nr:copper homeostasis protein CutC [Fuscovulum blasticum]AWD22307.1 copper homeostasis protein CutC [Fuscovulum blasticum]